MKSRADNKELEMFSGCWKQAGQTLSVFVCCLLVVYGNEHGFEIKKFIALKKVLSQCLLHVNS
jgi:hypothetical protein